MSTWLTALVTLASVLFGGGGLAVLVNAVTGRRPRKAEVADRLSESTLKWVEQFQEEAAAARTEAAEGRAAARREIDSMRQEVAAARLETAAARREVAQVRDEAERALRSIRLLVMSPTATLEQIRAHVTGPGWLNGQER